jgi:hypothetical protein
MVQVLHFSMGFLDSVHDEREISHERAVRVVAQPAGLSFHSIGTAGADVLFHGPGVVVKIGAVDSLYGPNDGWELRLEGATAVDEAAPPVPSPV